MTPVPSTPVALLDQLDAAREAAYDEVVRLCRGGVNRWTMSIPARPDADSDLLIAKALDDHKRLTAAVRAVLEKCEQMEREAPKPQVGGFMAEEFRRVVSAALSVTP